MNPENSTKWKAKHAWAELDRTGPPKRPAEQRVADFNEIYSLYDEDTVREQASRCIQCPDASCVKGCPLTNRIPEWIALAAEGDFLGAAAISRETSNLPEICSRVCPQERLCEGSCILNGPSEPICIGAIEKFINEYALAHGAVQVTPPPPNGLKAAVIGSGPGGLACADELAKLGYAVTLFESQMLPGGLLMFTTGVANGKVSPRLLAGSMLFALSMLSIMGLGSTLLEDRFRGRLKLIVTCPIAPTAYLAGVLLWAACQGLVSGLLVLLFARLFYFTPHVSGMLLPIAVLTVIPLSAVSLINARHAQSIHQGSLLNDIIGTGIVMICPVFYASDVLPAPLRYVSVEVNDPDAWPFVAITRPFRAAMCLPV
jgi:hypothetical protein